MRRRHRTPQVVSFALLLSLLLSLLCLRACLAQDVPDATAPATIAHDIEGAPPLDDPEGEFEKKDAPPIVPCDDGIGPDPNRMPPALPPPPEGEKSGDGAGGESGSGGMGMGEGKGEGRGGEEALA